MRFSGKTVLVTGVASGLGRAVAQALANEGARLVLVDRAKDQLENLVLLLRGEGADVVELVGDVSQEETSQQAVELARSRFSSLDILINNAGINPTGTISQTDPAMWQQALDVNLKSAYLFCRQAIPHMVEAGKGVIVNTASIAGQRASTAEAVYGVSKAGLIMLTRTIARDYGAKGIRANAICPGVLESVMADRLTRMSAEQVAARDQRFAPTVPLGRLGTYEEIAKATLFLASDDASYVNGAQLTVDGGLTA
ncbi:Bacilysin biosynthesis oxidoreductase (plasmid) [Neorhizobium galegae bv. officinalis bv. officinalis str. HAMBI 1141]|uniref:Bacilysin biosynthesis oxidoreductase n=1 Tax=Neorhizobium galegae bv. officinalis bv. officinalis str. HAMBI 1141 TaxID=1028801 RepID=A0A068THI3_NEOGA|nr:MULTISPECIES: SDR family NAD(P)-dependent oxidoreductase [Neorhizobium]MCJ9670758.1 SDR family oxidoreductase [Neorhizobium sp. SHOUNA12B]MCJ9745831.1 SDR family oxidoreductase [Neorhizobium sp. SHOUNA12A]MCJ9751432.1 SDR family oxidoreductase [Neorhizobium sp. BETTINA12A]CDN57584.1 Bacilysin biosynthesis oxidoreductase [Neorhizobium galegae bv. officinalis bv. officinalis str. HAMBI 1141]